MPGSPVPVMAITLLKPASRLAFLTGGYYVHLEEDGRIVAVAFAMEESPGSTGQVAR